MGIVRQGPPKEFVLGLAEEFDVDSFVETGTYKGDTVAWASDFFDRVVSIELSDDYYERAVKRYGDREPVELLHGRSEEELPDVLKSLDGSAILWLDAHFSGGDTAGEDHQCPLLDELAALEEAEHRHYVLVDDARRFLAPPPPPGSPEEWPTIGKVLDAMADALGEDYHVVVCEDVVVAVPPAAEPFVTSHFRSVVHANENPTPSEQLREGAQLLRTGLHRLLLSDPFVDFLKKVRLYPVARRVYRALV